MLQHIIDGIEKGLTSEVRKLADTAVSMLRKRVFALVLQVILFSAASIFLLLGFILLADNFIPTEFVLLATGAVLFLAMLLLAK
ncbi:MAG TPA: hypothetical protein VJH22_07445 [Candidatus Nanoarchaeia archaeon]|nr:hypothetical protein [Candidatus Nanoarchaeia archaeon]